MKRASRSRHVHGHLVAAPAGDIEATPDGVDPPDAASEAEEVDRDSEGSFPASDPPSQWADAGGSHGG